MKFYRPFYLKFNTLACAQKIEPQTCIMEHEGNDFVTLYPQMEIANQSRSFPCRIGDSNNGQQFQFFLIDGSCLK